MSTDSNAVRSRPSVGARARRALRTLLALLAGTLLALLLLEGLLRLHYGRPLAGRYFRPLPTGIGYALAVSQVYDYLHDGRPVRVSTGPDGTRIVPGAPDAGAAPELHVIGDSQVFGWGLSDDEALPAVLQRRLGPRWRVVNHGVPGYGPFAYADVIAAVPREARVLVVQTEANDLLDAYARRPPAFSRCGFLVPRTFLGERLPCALLDARLFTKLIELRIRLGDVRHSAPLGFNPHARAAARVLRYRLDQLFGPLEAARRGGIAFTVIPWDAALAPARSAFYTPTWAHPERQVELRDDCGLVAAFAAQPDPERLFLPRDYHVSPEGAAFTAARLAECVNTKLTLETPTPAWPPGSSSTS